MPPDEPSETRTDHWSEGGVAASALLPVLTVVHHPDVRHLGARHVLRDGERLMIGRGASCFGDGVLEDGRLSRRHMEVRRAGQHVHLTDLDSRNGTFVDGERVDVCELRRGASIAVGGVILLLDHGPVFHDPPGHPRLVGIGSALAGVLSQVARIAASDATVLIQGETGVGKELVAREIHLRSGRPGSFVAINCGGLAEGVLQSELFGHARGAYSGADADRSGLVAAAAAGTLLLDEIGDAPVALQLALLRLLDNREYRSVGADQALRTDARFIAASHVELAAAVAEARFRRDLLGRLERFVIRVPPLRERPEDILPLAHHFARECAGGEATISRSLALALLRYRWPQNIRELAAVIEQAWLLADRSSALGLGPELAERLRSKAVPTPTVTSGAGRDARTRAAARPDAEALRRRFDSLGGNVKALASELGVARTTLYRWLAAAGVERGSSRK